MNLTGEGMRIDERDEQFENAASRIREMAGSDSKVTRESDSHSEKHLGKSVPTEEGMQIDKSDEHSENEARSISERFVPCSNVNSESDRHSEKPLTLRWRVEEGMQIWATPSSGLCEVVSTSTSSGEIKPPRSKRERGVCPE
jgi:hypothetical protein